MSERNTEGGFWDTPKITDTIITDDLGFPLMVTIIVGEFDNLGSHHCCENYETGVVDAGSPHKIKIKSGLDSSTVCMVAAHESYHLFKTIRHLISVDEEVEATVFGELVKRIHQLSATLDWIHYENAKNPLSLLPNRIVAVSIHDREELRAL